MKKQPFHNLSQPSEDTPYREFYRGARLPHWQPENAVLFITARLHGSLPWSAIKKLKIRTEREKERLLKQGHPPEHLQFLLSQQWETYFGKYDKLLDDPTSGPTWLTDPRICRIVQDAFLWGEQNGRYKLICSTIMSNHIHFIAYKFDRMLYRIMQSFKRHTARQANIVLGRTGNPFWAEESFDHCIRTREALQRKICYVLQNAVKAGLVDHWKDWPYTYIRPDFLSFAP